MSNQLRVESTAAPLVESVLLSTRNPEFSTFPL